MDNFESFDLPEALLHRLAQAGFTEPTPIQKKAIPEILAGRDILGSAQTGTGKTGAFGIPLAMGLMAEGTGKDKGTALVITPTRELAQQVEAQLRSFIPRKANIQSVVLIGGEAYGKQISKLKAKPRLIVGTPGRINDHLERGTLKLHQCVYLVLDETDRMLDMGFSSQIERILKDMPEERQTLLFSATLPKNIMSLAGKYLSDPLRIAVAQDNKVAENIDHKMQKISDSNKLDVLREALNERKGSVILFVKTKYGTERMAKRIEKWGHEAVAIHGDLKQAKRKRVIDDYRREKFRVLVATDVAARGLDIPHIEHVINYDLPQSPEDYIHRIGRTARAGEKGHALALVTPADIAKWNAILKLIDPKAPREEGGEEAKPKGKGKGRPPRRRTRGGGKPGGGKAKSNAGRRRKSGGR